MNNPIGFDSYTVKQEHVQEEPWRPLQILTVLKVAAETEAECSVCHVALGPLLFDKNHHCSLNDGEVGDQVIHYCAEHCPNCGKEDD